jgi:hypothetical protein
VGHAWVVLLPLSWSALYLVVLRIADLVSGACSVCGSDESWGNYPFLFVVFAVVPATASVLTGLSLRSAMRALRRPGTGSSDVA